MNIDNTLKAAKLIETRSELLEKLSDLKKASGYPTAAVRYFNNSHIAVDISISKQLQPVIETILTMALRGQIADLDRRLEDLGVSTNEV